MMSMLCNCCVRELLILARTWFAFGLPSKTGCDNKFQWTSEAQEALDALKKFLTTPPVLKPPRRATPIQPAADLLLYISCMLTW
jgi:hypothetical protein